MKEEILQALKTKYQDSGFKEKAFNGVADYLSKTVTEKEQIETAIAGVEGLFKAFQGEVDVVRTEKTGLQKQLDELKAKHSKPKPKEEEKEKEKEIPEWAKAIAEENKTLKETIEKIQGDNISKSRAKMLETILNGTSEVFSKSTRTSFEVLKNSDDETFSNWLESTKETAKEDITRQAAYTPRSGVRMDSKASDEECESIVNNVLG